MTKRTTVELIPIEKFNYDRSIEPGFFSVFKRVLSSHEVVTFGTIHNPHRGIKRISDEFYIKIVPCNPVLNFFQLFRYDKNQKYFEPTVEIKFADDEAKEYYEKFKIFISPATTMSTAYIKEK